MSMAEALAMFRLGDLIADPALQIRPIDPVHVAHLEGLIERDEGSKLPKPVVTSTGAIVGGHHTIKAWLRALGPDGMCACRVVNGSVDELLEVAIRNNRNHGLPIRDRESVYYMLTHDRKWSKRKAMDALGLSDTIVGRYKGPYVAPKMVRMEATRAESPGGSERATPAEPTAGEERAVASESPDARERATPVESTGSDERAVAAEPSVPDERAISAESPATAERAVVLESTDRPERAIPAEPPSHPERAGPCESPASPERPLLFHVGRLMDLLPAGTEVSGVVREALVGLRRRLDTIKEVSP